LELASRLPAHVRSQTLNAMGFGAWARNCPGKLVVDGMKTRKIMDKLVPADELGRYASALPRIVGLAKSAGIVPLGSEGRGLTEDSDYNWREKVDFHDIQLPEKARTGRLIELAREVLAESIRSAGSVVDFDDQL